MGQSESFLDKHYYLLRRLHSLSGIVPIGAFLIAHLTTNSTILWGHLDSRKRVHGHSAAAAFQEEVNWIHSLPALILIEIFVLWLPIAFHAGLGVVYAISGKSNTSRYAYQANYRYWLQRMTGYIGILFIFYHIATLRWHWTFLVPGGTEWSATFAASTLGAVLQGGTQGMTLGGAIVTVGYMVGVTALVFHFANGLWTAAITWGVTQSRMAMRRWGQVCTAIGAGLMLMAWGAVIGFATLDIRRAESAERSVHGGHAEGMHAGETATVGQSGE
ncbi:MAG: hypothetical protein KF745_01820 [Phycisphaeraceae bacterium]|nr:hypothetical protein [Phycisphaeraceae bacterium]